jgi:hypothetical protein
MYIAPRPIEGQGEVVVRDREWDPQHAKQLTKCAYQPNKIVCVF